MTFFARFRYWLPLLPLLALLAFVYWLDIQVQQEISAAASKPGHDPDVIMENFHATKMDQQGVPRFLLSAQQLRHYPDHDSTELDLPHITLLTEQRKPVNIGSVRGVISSKGDEVLFFGNVLAAREASHDQTALALRTEYLRVVPAQDLATTDQPVTLVNTNNTVRAIGLEMDNKARTLKLLSQVRSEHIPNAK